MEKRYRVTLTKEERQDLQKMVSTGQAAANFVWTYLCGRVKAATLSSS